MGHLHCLDAGTGVVLATQDLEQNLILRSAASASGTRPDIRPHPLTLTSVITRPGTQLPKAGALVTVTCSAS